MNSPGFKRRRRRGSLKLTSLCVAATALAVMGAVTVEAGSVGTSPRAVATGADTMTSPTPATTPAVGRAAPVVKATTFVGGDWPGLGSFGEDWAK